MVMVMVMVVISSFRTNDYSCSVACIHVIIDDAKARMEVIRSQDQLAALKDQWSKEQAERVRELEATHGKVEDLHMTYETKTKSTLTMLKEDYKQEMALATKANQVDKPDLHFQRQRPTYPPRLNEYLTPTLPSTALHYRICYKSV